MKLVSLKDLSVSYEGKEALFCKELSIYENDFIGVIGPNGGGKTTLIKTILKSIPYKGSVEYVDGLNNIGYLPQISSLDKTFPISVREVVVSGLQSQKGLLGRYSKDDYTKAESLLDITGIKRLYNKTIGALSGGEFQRVMLCRALISNPRLLILDEPNNFVDNKFESELYELLKELNSHMAIIIVSHDIGTISSYIKSIVCVNHNVHRHNSNTLTAEQLINYNCPIQLVYHGDIPHIVLEKH